MNPKDFDLSGLPPEQRAKWQARLDQLPAGVRESLQRNLARVPPEKVAKILQESSPMLERVLGRVQTAQGSRPSQNQPPPRAAVVKIASDDYYNTTVQQGDRPGLPVVPLIGLIAAVLLLLRWLLGES